MTIPDGPLGHSSAYEPEPLSDEERWLLILAGVGISGWSFAIPYTTSGERDTACNYANRLIGRSFPSGAGAHSSELLITDDRGSHMTQFRDLDAKRLAEYGQVSDLPRLQELLAPHLVTVAEGRVEIPAEPPHLVGHNPLTANKPGTTLFVPVVDTTQHELTLLYILSGEGYLFRDHRSGRALGDPGPLFELGALDETMSFPLEELERLLFGSVTGEATMMAYNVTLLMQAIGLGGWTYGGINAHTILRAFASDGLPGFGFPYETDPRWPAPNPVGLDGLLEPFAPPYTRDLRQAAQLFATRKFGHGGTHDPATPGPGATAQDSRPQPSLTRPSSSSTSARSPRTCTTAMASLQERFRRSGPGSTPKRTTPISTSTTVSTSTARRSRRTAATSSAGTGALPPPCAGRPSRPLRRSSADRGAAARPAPRSVGRSSPVDVGVHFLRGRSSSRRQSAGGSHEVHAPASSRRRTEAVRAGGV